MSGLILPDGYESRTDPIVGKCLVPDCGAVFYKGQENDWQRHVGECARANMDAIRELSQARSQAGTIFDENEWDPEAAAWLQGPVREAMLREGRMTLKPNERVGT